MSSTMFERGDVVELKSGGIKMTVVLQNGNDVTCEWLDTIGNFHREKLYVTSLVKVDGEPATTEAAKPKAKRSAPKINRSGMVL